MGNIFKELMEEIASFPEFDLVDPEPWEKEIDGDVIILGSMNLEEKKIFSVMYGVFDEISEFEEDLNAIKPEDIGGFSGISLEDWNRYWCSLSKYNFLVYYLQLKIRSRFNFWVDVDLFYTEGFLIVYQIENLEERKNVPFYPAVDLFSTKEGREKCKKLGILMMPINQIKES